MLTDMITVFTEVTLAEHRREDLIRFERSVAGVEELLERDIGIEKYFSYVVLKSPIVRTNLPVETLIGDR
jgi:hypothetical protein